MVQKIAHHSRRPVARSTEDDCVSNDNDDNNNDDDADDHASKNGFLLPSYGVAPWEIPKEPLRKQGQLLFQNDT